MISFILKTLRKKQDCWYAHPEMPDTLEDQLLWRKAVFEVMEITGDDLAPWKSFPNQNLFNCTSERCGEAVSHSLICGECGRFS